MRIRGDVVRRGAVRAAVSLVAGVVAFLLVALTAACQGSAKTGEATGSDAGAGASPSASSSSSADASPGASSGPSTAPSAGPAGSPVIMSFAPAPGSRNVRPDQPVTVSLVGGDLTSVRMTDATGKDLAGAVDETGTWRNTDPLTSAARYRVEAVAAAPDGTQIRQNSSFSTARAVRLASTTLIPGDDWNVGVGMPVIVVFSQPVKNRQAAQAALTVTSTPSVEGAWRWFSATEVHWRPRQYWPSGTKVTVRAATSGVELAKGTWGRRTVTSSFTIGRSQIMTVDMARHTLTVRRDGRTVRNIPVTTGKPGFSTRNGVKVVMSRESQVRMDAASTGTDPKDPEYYDLLVNWALRLTYSGEFLHAAPWSVGSQGRVNVSHGCTGMSTSNARWLFDNSAIGDVVVYTGGSRALEWGNGYTEWNIPFEKYAAGA